MALLLLFLVAFCKAKFCDFHKCYHSLMKVNCVIIYTCVKFFVEEYYKIFRSLVKKQHFLLNLKNALIYALFQRWLFLKNEYLCILQAVEKCGFLNAFLDFFISMRYLRWCANIYNHSFLSSQFFTLFYSIFFRLPTACTKPFRDVFIVPALPIQWNF